jgi:large subunit ribosomal protein L6
MSRIAKNPVKLPAKVEAKVAGTTVTVKGPLGELSRTFNDQVSIKLADGAITCGAVSELAFSRAMSGTARALIANMVTGVEKGFERKLSLVGVGYKAQAQGDKINLSLGFSHPVVHAMPKGVKCETPTPTEIIIKGADKQLVGQIAAEIRGYKPPEPYKGKGVRYSDETITLKETKKK